MVALALKPAGAASDGAPTEADLRALLPRRASGWRVRPFSADVVAGETAATGWDARGPSGAVVRLVGPSDADGAAAGPLEAWRLEVSCAPATGGIVVVAFAAAALVTLLAVAAYVALLHWLGAFVPLALLFVVSAFGLLASVGAAVRLSIFLLAAAAGRDSRLSDAITRGLVDEILSGARGGGGVVPVRP